MNRRKKVVVTGLGTVNPLGLNTDDTWKSLLGGKSGIGLISSFDPDASGLGVKIAGEVKNFDPENWLSAREVRRLDRFSQFSLIPAIEAVKNAHLELNEINKNEVGVLIGTGIGGAQTLIKQNDKLNKEGLRKVSPNTIPMLMPNAAASAISIHMKIHGPSLTTNSACASAADAIGTGLNTIREGKAKVILAGGSEAAILPITVAGFQKIKALSKRNDEPEKASRPFDELRDGFVISEGGAVLVLEDEEHAIKREANILCELAGYGAADDAFNIVAPDPLGIGAITVMKKALDDACIRSYKVEYINAHGTSTPLNDEIETRAIREVFGEYANIIKVNSTKSMTGHLCGAAGAIEALACVKTISTGWIHPTINLEVVDPECNLNHVTETSIKADPKVALSNSFGFGGHNSCLAFVKYERGEE